MYYYPYLIFAWLLLLCSHVISADDARTANVTKTNMDGNTVQRTAERYKDSLYIPLLSSRSYMRQMSITVGGNYAIKRANKVQGDPGSNWRIVRNGQQSESLNNIKEQSITYQGTQIKGASGKNYRPEFTGIAGPVGGGGGGQPADYNWIVKMDGNHSILKHKVGVCGPSIAFEGSANRCIELYIGRTEDSPALQSSVTVYFTIDFAGSNLTGVHYEDFLGYQSGNKASVFRSGASWDENHQAFKTTITAGLNLSPKIIMEAAMQDYLAENSIEEATFRILTKDEFDYIVVEDGTQSKAKFWNWITGKQEENAKLYASCIISVIKDITRFGDKNNPYSTALASNISTTDIKQGATGNCYFLVVLLALADRASGKQFISSKSDQYYANASDQLLNDKTFSVGFVGQDNRKYKFKSSSPSFLNVGNRQSSLSGDFHISNIPLLAGVEIWPQLFETAWVEHVSGKPGLFAGDRWLKIDGGYVNVTWIEVTGKKAEEINVREKTNQEIWDMITQASERWVCVAASWKPGINQYGGLPNRLHAYYVKSINANTAHLMNPWGSHGDVFLRFDDAKAIDAVYYLEPVQ